MKPPKGWQEKQWYPEERQSIDLSSRLQSIEVQKYPKLREWEVGGRKLLGVMGKWLLGLGVFGVIGTSLYLYFGIPWHLKLFTYWLLRKTEITEIPTHLHSELDQLCRTADSTGQVNGYKGSEEIKYGLGEFQCKSSENGLSWVIHDTYGFDNTEALSGTQLAEFLVELWGKDYTYKINAVIPKKGQNWEVFDL